MQWLEVHNVGYGECIVLGARREILMTDCGSSNLKIPGGMDFSEYVQTRVMPRYMDTENRAFLLTHCHRDHMCGLRRILKLSPSYFNRIFLPAAPRGESGQPLLLEFALFAFVFLNRLTGYSKVNVSVLRLFSRAARAAGAEHVFPVKAGDSFTAAGTVYDVLWPRETDFPYSTAFTSAVGQLNACLTQPFLPGAAAEFLQLKQAFCSAYTACQSYSPVRVEYTLELEEILRRITKLIPNLLLLPCAPEITGILTDSEVQNSYSDTINAAGVVFQNSRAPAQKQNILQGGMPQDILMTGDAPPRILKEVSSSLYDGYYILKAPHHGTQSGFSPAFKEIAAPHVIISNGKYSGGGEISPEYAALPGVKHCTNPSVCAFYKENGYCCSSFAVCYEMPGAPALTVKCPHCRPNAKNPPCGIRNLDIGS